MHCKLTGYKPNMEPTVWWRGPGDAVYDAHFADISISGSQGSGRHVFCDVPTGHMYACTFTGVTGDFMWGMYGHRDSKFLATQVTWRGDCTWNNAWGTQMHIGGSDFNIDASMLNIGVSTSPAQWNGPEDRPLMYFIHFDYASGVVGGRVYVSGDERLAWPADRRPAIGASRCVQAAVIEGYKLRVASTR